MRIEHRYSCYSLSKLQLRNHASTLKYSHVYKQHHLVLKFAHRPYSHNRKSWPISSWSLVRVTSKAQKAKISNAQLLETVATPVFGSADVGTVPFVDFVVVGCVDDSTIDCIGGSVDGLSDVPDVTGTGDVSSAVFSSAAGVPGRAVDAWGMACSSSFVGVGSNFRTDKRRRELPPVAAGVISILGGEVS